MIFAPDAARSEARSNRDEIKRELDRKNHQEFCGSLYLFMYLPRHVLQGVRCGCVRIILG